MEWFQIGSEMTLETRKPRFSWATLVGDTGFETGLGPHIAPG